MKCLIENFLYNGILIFACKNRNAAKRFEKRKEGVRGEKRKNFLKIFSFVSPLSSPLLEAAVTLPFLFSSLALRCHERT